MLSFLRNCLKSPNNENLLFNNNQLYFKNIIHTNLLTCQSCEKSFILFTNISSSKNSIKIYLNGGLLS